MSNIISMLNINLTTHKHIHRIQITLLDYGFRVLSRLVGSYANHEQIRLLHNLYDEGGSKKFQYIRYPKPENPYSTLILHNATSDDQDFLIRLLSGHHFWISQVEFAIDFFPVNKDDFSDLVKALSDDLTLSYSRKNVFRFDNRTKYWGRKGKKVSKCVKFIRLYPRPKKGPFEYVRLELQLNRRGVKKHRLSLPISPDAVDPFKYIIYRKFDKARLTDILVRGAEKKLPKREPDKYDGLLNDQISSWVNFVIDPVSPNPFDANLPIQAQIDNFKRALPEQKHRLYHVFPKCSHKNGQLLEDIKNGFIKREY